MSQDDIPIDNTSDSDVPIDDVEEEIEESTKDDELPPASSEPAVGVPRLMIKKLKLHNFKSYAGDKEIGPFHHRFSAIVGPNGSGKSNLIDALLFVFGFRTKKLRLNKISELIHNSNHGSNLESASVEILFQKVIDIDIEKEEYEVVPNSEIRLKRVASCDNKSTYYVNDKKTTYNDVKSLLIKHHIDLGNNRFLILQGEVELISQMKPKSPTPNEDGLLEYIEDIIGSSRLIAQIEESVKSLEELNTERAQQLNRVKASEKARDSLLSSKNEAEQCLLIEGEIHDNNAILYQLQILANQIKMDNINEKAKPIEEKLQDLRDSMKEKTDKLKVLEDDYETKRKEHTKIAKELEQTKDEFYKFERKREKLKQDRSHHKKKSLAIGKQIEKDEKKLSEFIRNKETSELELTKTQEKIATLLIDQEKKEVELEEIQRSIQHETASLREAVEEQKTKLMPKKKTVNDLKSKIDIAQSELTLLEDKGNAGKKQLDEALEALEQISNRINEATTKITDLQNETKDAKDKLPKIQQELNSLQEEESKLTKNIRDMEAKYEESQLENQENTSRDKILNACLHLKDQKGLGVLGRLGNLGAIDPKYDIAISTACRELDSIVVETYQDAQECILHMKQHNLGRARFIILNDQQYLSSEMYKMKGKIPENAPRLFDLVQTNRNDILPVFYFALRDTLVAEDLQQAKRLAYGSVRFRVVTTSGNIIDKAGTVTGGGNTVSKGGMGSKLASSSGLSTSEMEKLKSKIDAARSKLNNIRKTIHSLKSEEERLEEIIKGASLQLTKLEMDATANKKHKKELQLRIPELEKNSSNTSNTEDKKRMKLLQKEIDDLQIPLEKALKDAATYEEEIQSLQQQIMDKGGLPLKIKQTEVDDIISLIDDTSKAESRHKVKIKTSAKKIENMEKSIEEQRDELKKELELYDVKQNELSQLTEQAKIVSEKFNNAQGVLDTTETDLQEATDKYQSLKSTVSKFQSTELDFVNQIDTFKQSLQKYEDIIKSSTQTLNDLEQKKKNLYAKNPDLSTPLKRLESSEIEDIDPSSVKSTIKKLETKLKSMKPNMKAIEDYREKDIECKERNGELDIMTTNRDNQQNLCEQLRKKRLDEFMAGFAVINRKLKEMYRMITLEGDAELEFVDSIDPFSEGIVFSVRPPKKSWKNIANLSGGEKTLSSLALVFALHHYKPTPLYFMDEIDAALDFKNVSIVAHYIKERTKNAQFIIISLRNNMFELADHLIGIYKPDNCTQSVTINPNNHTIGQTTKQ